LIEIYKMYDVAIVGCGPAGLNAALYCTRFGLKTVLFCVQEGGMISEAAVVENYLGFKQIEGRALIENFLRHVKSYDVEIVHEGVDKIEKKNGIFLVNGKYESRSIILACGSRKKKLGIEGESEFIGKGVSYCAVCDAPLYRDKVVAVIGGRNSATSSALHLANFAKEVYLVYRRGKLRADKVLVDKVMENEKIKLVLEAVPIKIKGDKFVEELVFEQKGEEKSIAVDGIFIEIGIEPCNALAVMLGVEIDEEGYIIVDHGMKTNVKGVFASGDLTNVPLKQIIVAAAQGAIAAASAKDFLLENESV